MKLLFRIDAAKRGFARKCETGISGIVFNKFSLVVLVSSVIVEVLKVFTNRARKAQKC